MFRYPLILTLFAAPVLAAGPSNCRLYLAGQYDWGAHTGFYLDLEGSQLDSLPLILVVGDGTQWRITSCVPKFVPEREYKLHASIAGGHAKITVDGREMADMEAAWKPLAAPLVANDKPGWANDPGDWIGVISNVSVAVDRGGVSAAKSDIDFSDMASRPPGLLFFEPSQPTSVPLDTHPGDALALDVTMRFVSSDTKRYAPYIDKYGQCRYADFPGKVQSDQDFQRDIADEDAHLKQMPPSPDFDKYGGYLKSDGRGRTLASSARSTGFFHLARRGDKWWLITPEGNPCFFTGVCGGTMQVWEVTPVTGREFLYEWLPPKTAPFGGAWIHNAWGVNNDTDSVSFYACNLLRKYGAGGWDKKPTERYFRRTRAFGLGGGKWGSPRNTPETPVLGPGDTPMLAGHPDVFDPAVRDALQRNLARQISPRLKDPWVIGWSFGNEYDQIIKRGEVKEILGKPAQTPARRAMIDYAKRELYGGDDAKLRAAWKIDAAVADVNDATLTVPDADVERVRCSYEDRYYDTLYRTIKSIDPNHLYLGNWIVPSWWESEEDWQIHARHLDVIGYDRYAPRYSDALLQRLLRSTNKPAICGEFSLPAWYGGKRGLGRYGTWTNDEAESGELYYRWVQDAARDPYCVGLIWFMYRDQPLTGRGPGKGEALVYGEHYAFGLVTETDRVKWPLVTRMRQANLQAAKWRMR